MSRLLSLLEEPAEIQTLLAQDKLSVRYLRACEAGRAKNRRVELVEATASGAVRVSAGAEK